MVIFTIGFTQKTAEQFFNTLKDAGVQRVVDVRLNNTSQLSGFAKRDDLRYFLNEIAGIDYIHVPLLAPTHDILSAYRKKGIEWEEYERQFLAVLEERGVEHEIEPSTLDKSCLLCSEVEPDQCHRRLVIEYLDNRWGNIEVRHLGV